ncbi:protein phosphatase 2C domain-containing protein [Pasteurellaceae bacterium LIM206]|nr:protein phosphatase 2C domain-containing protein [Pasteurellaceae bacterium LIM206]
MPFTITFTQTAGKNKRNQDAIFNGKAVYQYKNKTTESLVMDQSQVILGVMDGVLTSPFAHKASLFWAKKLKYSTALSSQWIRNTHQQFCHEFTGQYYGSTTTLVAAQIHRTGECHIFNIGDSRAYKITAQGEWQQLSHDHIMLDEFSHNENKQYAKLYYCLSDFLTADYLESEFKIHQVKTRLNKDETLLLCSDGLTDFIPDKIRYKIWCSYHTIEERLTAFKRYIKKLDWWDDFSVICCQLQDE